MAAKNMLNTQNEQPQCRFCLNEKADSKNPFLTPCECRGTVEFVHLYCLNMWRNKNTERNYRFCTLCKTPYNIPEEYSLEHLPQISIYFIILDYPIWINFLFNYVWILWAGILQKNSPDAISTFITCQLVYKIYFLFSAGYNFKVLKKQRYYRAWLKESNYLFFPFYGFLVLISFFSQNPFYWFVPTIYMIMGWHIHLNILKGMNDEDMQIQMQEE